MGVKWDGDEKRATVSLSDHIGGMRYEITEIKAAMKDIATALRQLAVLEEQHKESRASLHTLIDDLKTHKETCGAAHRETDRQLAFYKGALWIIGGLLTVLAGIGTTITYKIMAHMEEATVHVQTDSIKTPQDVITAIEIYRNLQKGM